MDPGNTLQLPNGRATRSSLACLTCRSRHLKCDGKKPACSRCAEVARECQYSQSRRGGLDRAALADRRRRLAAEKGGKSGSPRSQQSAGSQPHRRQFTPTSIEVDFNSYGWLEGICMNEEFSNTRSPSLTHIDPPHNIEKDPLIDSYYNNFHKFHPFLLPRKYLTRQYRNPGGPTTFRPLIAVMRLVGHIYSSHEWSDSLKDQVEVCFSQALLIDPVMVQCRLLYFIALFWYEYKTDAKRQLESAAQIARDLQMFRREFSVRHGGDDPVLKECWRRTWWMLYIVDAYYTGTLGTMNFEVVNIDATVELPCEELEYESGDIPEPKTLEDFDSREFAPNTIKFSSLTYLIGAVRCAALAISAAPKNAKKEHSTHVIQAADASLNGWSLLLPQKDKQVMSETGEIDELMFQAHLLIHTATVGLHRPFSDLKFNAVEGISSCAREPPLDTQTPNLVNVHTVRVLRSVEAQIRLLALPVRQFHHTPFTTCMVSEGTLALLSACNFLLKGKDLTIARDQIRMTIGCLKALGELWPRIARNVREIQTIAQHVLGIGTKATTDDGDSARTNDVPELSGGEGHGSLCSGSDAKASSTDAMCILPSLDSIEDLCGWYDLGGIDYNLP